MTVGEDIVKRYDTLKAARSTLDSHLQEIAENLLPRRSDIITTVTSGQKIQSKIECSTPGKALARLAAVLHAMLTNTESQWFRVRLSDLWLNDVTEVKDWMDDVSNAMHQAFYDSNFALCAYEYFLDLGGICTACMYQQEGTENILQFLTVPVSSYVIAENTEGMVDTVIRTFKWTARQAEMQWGKEDLPDKVRQALENNKPDAEFTFMHAVFPRASRDITSLFAKDMPYASYYLEKDSKQIIRQGGYWEFPFAVARWSKMSGEIYGRGPGEEALPDIKSLYDIRRTIMRAGKKIVDPPLDVPMGAYDHDIRTGSNQINWRNANYDRITPLLLQGNLPFGKEEEQQLKDDIIDSFYGNQLQIIDRKQMTLGEVEQRSRENMRILGPTFGRLCYEFLNPIIKRAFGIMQRAGQFPDPPEALQGKKIGIEYVSQLSLAQQDLPVAATLDALNSILPMAEAFGPDVLDNIDPDEAARLIMKRRGVPADVQRDKKVIEQIRAARQQKQAELEQMEAMERGAEVGKNMQGIPDLRKAA